MRMAYGRSKDAEIAGVVLGAAAIVVGVLLYRNSGRDWESDLKLARDWFDDKTSDAQKVIDRTEKASKELLASAQSAGHEAIGAAKGAYEGAR